MKSDISFFLFSVTPKSRTLFSVKTWENCTTAFSKKTNQSRHFFFFLYHSKDCVKRRPLAFCG